MKNKSSTSQDVKETQQNQLPNTEAELSKEFDCIQFNQFWVQEIKFDDHQVNNEEILNKETPKEIGELLVGIIVTTNNGSSYDELFTKIPQEAKEGEKVAVYSTSTRTWIKIADVLSGEASLESLAEYAKAHNIAGDFEQLIQDIQNIDADSTVFNFECCSGCNNKGFELSDDESNFLKAVGKLINRGHMVMFSDFSLKALIAKWNEEIFGPNPFINIGEFSGEMDIKFLADTLKNSPSMQLAKVGELCPDGTSTIHCLGGTIAYTVDLAKADTDRYQLEVLTVATRLGRFNFEDQFNEEVRACRAGDFSGCAGHVLLTYPSGGKLLTSCGHWIELVKLDTNIESLLRVAQEEYGEKMYSEIRNEYAEANDFFTQTSIRQKYAQRMIQSSSPSKRSNKMYRKM